MRNGTALLLVGAGLLAGCYLLKKYQSDTEAATDAHDLYGRPETSWLERSGSAENVFQAPYFNGPGKVF